MKKFSDFAVKTNTTAFKGDKIKMERVLNREIVILDYRIEPSNFEGERLTLQIEVSGEPRVIFTASKILMETIQQVPRTDFPFLTTIIKANEYFEFS
jgi:hypothetical protein